jgi:hypothetical protein
MELNGKKHEFQMKSQPRKKYIMPQFDDLKLREHIDGVAI